MPVSMMPYNTGPWAAGDAKPEEPVQHDVIKTGSCSADVIPEEPDQRDFR